MTDSLLVVGWSARAAVQSARRAGFRPTAIDAFGDADLCRDAVLVRRMAAVEQLPALAAAMPPSDWMFVGGLENHPEVVAEVGRRHRLLGIGSETLKRVRDVFELRRVLVAAGFRFPEVRGAVEGLATETWLVKRRRSAGGIGVDRYESTEPIAADCYLQRFVEGTPYGATFVAASGRARLLGICRSLISRARNSAPFLYGGSIGPVTVPLQVVDELHRLGEFLAAEFQLVGLFGVDLILDAAGAAWVLEVNPRYTASIEVLERATSASLIDFHVRACRDGALTDDPQPMPAPLLHGKRIIYASAENALTVTPDVVDHLLANGDVADVPSVGSVVRRGEPLATVFAAGATEEAVEALLAARERKLLECFSAVA